MTESVGAFKCCVDGADFVASQQVNILFSRFPGKGYKGMYGKGES
jgi:hypothetical protein